MGHVLNIVDNQAAQTKGTLCMSKLWIGAGGDHSLGDKRPSHKINHGILHTVNNWQIKMLCCYTDHSCSVIHTSADGQRNGIFAIACHHYTDSSYSYFLQMPIQFY